VAAQAGTVKHEVALVEQRAERRKEGSALWSELYIARTFGDKHPSPLFITIKSLLLFVGLCWS
jgi:hypothetical protein